MHEATLMTALMRHVLDAAHAENARRVTSIAVWLGALSHMSAAHFAEHFEQASAGTIAEGARLDLTLSIEIDHANANEILLESVEVETP
jgi:hydrogenase nickel incorporation protein HypA/HybF